MCAYMGAGVCAPVHSRPSELTNEVHTSCFLCAVMVDVDEGFLALLLPLARSLGVGNVAEKEVASQRCFLYLDPF